MDGTITTRVVCAILFLTFTFAWLFWFQADILAVAQHGLSGGKTHYDRTVGAVITTAVLFLLQLLIYALTRLHQHAHALTYLPSMLLLAFMSSISHPFSWGAWLWVGPILLVAWGAGVWAARRLQTITLSQRSSGLFSRQMWVNLLQMAAMMTGVAAVSNTNAIDHFKAHAEVALRQGDIEEVLHVGARSLETDESLTMLRILALSEQGQLPERLFHYAIKGTSADMLPLSGSKSHLQLLDDSIVWNHFGVRPQAIIDRADSLHRKQPLTVSLYLDSLEQDTLATTAFMDYRLMGHLINRNLSAFTTTLPHYYTVQADSLPCHYREALILYQQKVDTLFIYSDTLMLERWHEFMHYDSIYSQKSERLIRSQEDFGHTYWYYFFQ